MSDSQTSDSPGARSLWKAGPTSATIWAGSCLLHILLLWMLSTLPMARGLGGDSDAGGLMIEGRFLGTSGEGSGGDGPDAEGSDPTSVGPEFRLVSATPETSETTEETKEVDEQSSPDEPVDSAEETAAPAPERRSNPLRRELTVIDPDNREPRRRSRTRSNVDTASEIDRPGRRPNHGNGAGGGAGPGGGTTFFDISGRGTKFVYIIDRSDSMLHKRRLDAARSELLASINELAESNFLQVVFYNDDVVSLASSDRPTLLRNTPVQQRKIAQFAAGIQPDGGTNHLRALHVALQLAPDAIFLLTDADEPKLHAADLDKLQRANRRHVPIHAVELGIGPLLESENFLMRLARQNRGTYRYWNIEDLSGDRVDGEDQIPSKVSKNPQRAE